MQNSDQDQTNSFVGFYDQVQQVPVSQFDSGSATHKIRRLRLLTSLGISPSTIKGSKILEIGPGGGDNAEVVLSWLPKKLSLVDGSKTAISQLKSRFHQHEVEIIHGDFLKCLPNEQYDLIIAEGCVPGQKNPKSLVAALCERLALNGQLVITTQTSESLLSEILRRIVAKYLMERADSFEEKVSLLSDFFGPSLWSLAGMSRPVEDWVIDVLVHPWELGNHVFSPKDAIEATGFDIELIATRPQIFINDYWYKNDIGRESLVTRSFKDGVEHETYKFLDYRQTQQNSGTLTPQEAKKLSTACQNIYNLHTKYTIDNQIHATELINELELILKIINTTFPLTCASLEDFIKNFRKLFENPTVDPFSQFHLWFGRGQQYLSLMKVR